MEKLVLLIIGTVVFSFSLGFSETNNGSNSVAEIRVYGDGYTSNPGRVMLKHGSSGHIIYLPEDPLKDYMLSILIAAKKSGENVKIYYVVNSNNEKIITRVYWE